MRAADDALLHVGPSVLLTEDVRSGVASLLEKGPGHARFAGR